MPSQRKLAVFTHCGFEQHYAKVEACTITNCYHVAMTTLARSLIWPYNNPVLSHYTSSFSISASLALKPMKRGLSLCYSYLGVLARVSTTRLTT